VNRAIASARAFMPAAQGALIVVRTGQMREFVEPGEQQPGSNEHVWALVFRGAFEGSCGPAPLPGHPAATCPPPATTVAVFVDYITGQALSAAFPAPQQLLSPSG
jgi:hypothetical protein